MIRLMLMFTISVSAFAMTEGPLSIEEFGQGGRFEATVFGSKVPESFYRQSPMKVIASGELYTSVIELNQHSTDVNQKREGHVELLIFNEEEEMTNSIVLTATKDETRAMKKFIIQIGPREDQLLDLSALAGYDTVFLHSGKSFTAFTERWTGLRAGGFEEAQVLTPIEKPLMKAAPDFCQPITVQRPMRKRNENDILSVWFDRQINEGSTPDRRQYGLDLYYPDMSTLIFRTLWPSHTSTDCTGVYLNYEIATNTLYEWNNVENVLFNKFNDSGTAVCAMYCQPDDQKIYFWNILF